jgi:hypothetical protein
VLFFIAFDAAGFRSSHAWRRDRARHRESGPASNQRRSRNRARVFTHAHLVFHFNRAGMPKIPLRPRKYAFDARENTYLTLEIHQTIFWYTKLHAFIDCFCLTSLASMYEAENIDLFVNA